MKCKLITMLSCFIVSKDCIRMSSICIGNVLSSVSITFYSIQRGTRRNFIWKCYYRLIRKKTYEKIKISFLKFESNNEKKLQLWKKTSLLVKIRLTPSITSKGTPSFHKILSSDQYTCSRCLQHVKIRCHSFNTCFIQRGRSIDYW